MSPLESLYLNSQAINSLVERKTAMSAWIIIITDCDGRETATSGNPLNERLQEYWELSAAEYATLESGHAITVGSGIFERTLTPYHA